MGEMAGMPASSMSTNSEGVSLVFLQFYKDLLAEEIDCSF